MRKLISIAFILIGAILGARAQAPPLNFVVYDQDTHTCQLTGCLKAQFTEVGDPANYGTLSYSCLFRQMGQQNVPCNLSWNGTPYKDAVGSMYFQGYGPITPQHTRGEFYPDGVWEVYIAFPSGNGTLAEVFHCFKSCGPTNDYSGQVVFTPPAPVTQ